MKIAYFDCVAGASGDMILGALLDAGLPEATLRERLAALKLNDFELHSERVSKNAFSATKVHIHIADNVPERHLAEIEALVKASTLSPAIQNQALAIFKRLCEAEAKIHGTTFDKVHLHELGGVDTIVDVVGTLVGLGALGIEQVHASPLPLGHGVTHGAHGYIPLPAPATIALLCGREGGVPITRSDLKMETVTPTGAVLLTTLAQTFGPLPSMTLSAVGYGAGTKDLPIPNVLRILIGETEHAKDSPTHPQPHSHPHHDASPTHTHPHPHPHPHTEEHQAPLTTSTLLMLETNIDDLNPEFYEYVMTRLFDAGALDVFLSPIQMKKNRPATLLHVLCQPDHATDLKNILFTETSTLGIREHTVSRQALPRALHKVNTPYGVVQVKVTQTNPDQVKMSPEYEDCRRLALDHNCPLRDVYRAAQRAAEEQL